MSFLIEILVLILEIAFGLYTLAVLLRFLFQLLRVDFYNPIGQFIVALTNPVLRPFRRVVPGLFGIDFASLLLLIVIKVVKLYLIGSIPTFAGILFGGAPGVALVSVFAVRELLILTLQVFLVAILIRAVMSWFLPYGGHGNPLLSTLAALTEPLLRRPRYWIPPVGGIDLSPLVVSVVLLIAIRAVQELFNPGLL